MTDFSQQNMPYFRKRMTVEARGPFGRHDGRSTTAFVCFCCARSASSFAARAARESFGPMLSCTCPCIWGRSLCKSTRRFKGLGHLYRGRLLLPHKKWQQSSAQDNSGAGAGRAGGLCGPQQERLRRLGRLPCVRFLRTGKAGLPQLPQCLCRVVLPVPVASSVVERLSALRACACETQLTSF